MQDVCANSALRLPTANGESFYPVLEGAYSYAKNKDNFAFLSCFGCSSIASFDLFSPGNPVIIECYDFACSF
jgi:hypothetical protein